MPRTLDEIFNQAETLAARFENHQPDPGSMQDAQALRQLRQAFLDRAKSEQRIVDAVQIARADGHSWASIGAMLATTGEAARQRYGSRLAQH